MSFQELTMNRIITLLFIAALTVLGTACATTEYNPLCLKECERGSRECSQSCVSLRIPMSEGDMRGSSLNRGLSGFDNCSGRCEKIYRRCKKRCERVLTIDADK